MTTIVSINDLTYAYPPVEPEADPAPVLQGVSLSLERGACLVLLGPTGAGKSTLCLSLNGTIPHLLGGTFSGSVSIAGLDTLGTKPGELSHAVGLVFQDPESQLFTMSVADEVAFGPEGLALPSHEIEERVQESLATLGIAHLCERSPLELSGGEQQRVALAAALALRPQVLVLDEPTASLDPLGKRSVLEAIKQLRDQMGMTILWVTQDIDAVPHLADRVAVLVDGRIVLEGVPSHVLQQRNSLERWGLRAPQILDLAARFNEHWGTNYAWLTVDKAQQALEQRMTERRG